MLEEARRRLVASPLATDPRLAEVLPVHGDFHFENVLFAQDRVAGLIDFDNATVAPRPCDLGSALAVVCQQREHEEDFLAAYESTSGLPRPDAEILRACVLLRLVNSLGFQVVALTRRRVASPEKARWWIRRLGGLLRAELRDPKAVR
ncbi:MAG: phosphotransferase [Krumholzibacteria bacterium]|nr:phosphotransferase [Candidatus Krumholzibacteria bacterium]